MSLAAVIERSRQEREAWKYTSLEALAGLSFSESPLSSLKKIPLPDTPHRIVFMNGVWQPTQSHLSGLPADFMQGSPDEGYKLTLPEQMCLVTAPLEMLFLNQPGDGPTETRTKLHISLGASGRLTLVERHQPYNLRSTPMAHIVESVIDLAPQAKLVHGKILEGNAGTVHLAQTNAKIGRGAFYDNFALLRGGKITRNELDVTLGGKLAQCSLRGAMLLRNGEHADTTTSVTHLSPHCSSRQIFRSVIDDDARGVFQGKIVVNESAQKTDAYQLHRALLLSDKAEVDAKPELEIYADDVKCSHGNTVGDLDEPSLFYLRSRGIGEKAARALLIKAFVNELTDDIQSPELREAARIAVEDWLQ